MTKKERIEELETRVEELQLEIDLLKNIKQYPVPAQSPNYGPITVGDTFPNPWPYYPNVWYSNGSG